MSKILNIESLAPSERVLRLMGQEHPIRDMSVQEFLNAVSEQKADETAKPKTVAEQVIAAIDQIINFAPTAPRETLNKLSFDQLGMILAFIHGNLEVDATGQPVIKTEASAAEGEAGKAKG